MSWEEAFRLVGAAVASIGGASLVIWALGSWLGKVWAGRILETDRARYATELESLKGELEESHRRLQAELDNTIHVHRIQFETELKALTTVWEGLARTRRAIASLRPRMDIIPAGETPDERRERYNRRLETLGKSNSALQDSVDLQSPFYPKNILDELSKALLTAKQEFVNVQLPRTPEDDDPDWFERGETNVQKFLEHSTRVSELIRERIAELQIRE